MNKTTNTGVRGIYFRAKTNRFEAHFQAFNSKKIHIGSYDTLAAATIARSKFIDNLK